MNVVFPLRTSRYLQQRRLLIGATPYHGPILALVYGQVDITKDGCGDVGVSESVYIGLWDVDEDVFGGIGVRPFEVGIPEMDMNRC